jgi:hypothetical protein
MKGFGVGLLSAQNWTNCVRNARLREGPQLTLFGDPEHFLGRPAKQVCRPVMALRGRTGRLAAGFC